MMAYVCVCVSVFDANFVKMVSQDRNHGYFSNLVYGFTVFRGKTQAFLVEVM